MILMGSDGSIVKYPTSVHSILPPPETSIRREKTVMESGVTALYMDDKNEEGIFGSTAGDIYYINLAE